MRLAAFYRESCGLFNLQTARHDVEIKVDLSKSLGHGCWVSLKIMRE